MNFTRVSPEQTHTLIIENDAVVIDIRDQASYDSGHIPEAMHFSEIDTASFIDAHPKQQPLIICCYHGNSSLNAANYFASQGLDAVSSMDGGFELWQQLGLPTR